MPKFSQFPRFFVGAIEQDAIDRAGKVGFSKLPKWLDSSIDPDGGVPFSRKHRFTPREDWLVENPHMYLTQGDGSFISEKMPHHRYVEDPKRLHRKLAKEKARVKITELEFDRNKLMEASAAGSKSEEKHDLAAMLRREGLDGGGRRIAGEGRGLI